MSEKILIKSEQYNVKTLFKIMVIIGIVLSVIMFITSFFSELGNYDLYFSDYEETYYLHNENGCDYDYYYINEGDKCWNCQEYEDGKFAYAVSGTFYMANILICLIPFAGLLLVGGVLYLWLRSYELTITNKRVFGKVAWGKRVDLPVDFVSATATISLLKGVSVSTSSGRISFLAIKNAGEIYEAISNLLIKRQQESENTGTAINVPSSVIDEVEQLKKYKELFDCGVITQEEFDAKKKQLLGL